MRKAPTEEMLTQGQMIRELREKAGMKQADLALAAGVSKSQVCKMEAGQQLGSKSLPRLMAILAPQMIAEVKHRNGTGRRRDPHPEAMGASSTLRMRRIAAGMTQKELAKRSGFSSSYVAWVETGRAKDEKAARLMIQCIGEPRFSMEKSEKKTMCYWVKRWQFTPGKVYSISRDMHLPSTTGQSKTGPMPRWEKDRRMEYLRDEGVNHIFHVRNGNYLTCYTDQQLVGMTVEEVKKKK